MSRRLLTVAELIYELSHYPSDAPVLVSIPYQDTDLAVGVREVTESERQWFGVPYDGRVPFIEGRDANEP